MDDLLTINNLHTYFYTQDSVIKAVEGLDLKVRKDEIMGLVGESACGKTVAACSVVRLIQPPGKVVSGEVFFEGQDLLKASESSLRNVRGKSISIVFQEPGASLNPLFTIGYQIAEMIKTHNKSMSVKEVNSSVLDLLRRVEIPKPEIRARDYPHNLSGGEAQRVMIAMALSCNPKLLIADEPTTSLDVTIQEQIMRLFIRLKSNLNFSLIFITHDLPLCFRVCDRIAVMYAGKVVELACRDEIFNLPLHPYTQALLSSVPKDEAFKQRFNVIKGSVPDSALKPSGCHFHPRCPLKEDICVYKYPESRQIKTGHWASCHMVK